MVHKLGVTLEELYSGKTRKIAANRDLECQHCQGKGGTRVNKCLDCKAREKKGDDTIGGLSHDFFSRLL